MQLRIEGSMGALPEGIGEYLFRQLFVCPSIVSFFTHKSRYTKKYKSSTIHSSEFRETTRLTRCQTKHNVNIPLMTKQAQE